MTAGSIDAMKVNIDRFLCSANDAVSFKLAQNISDLDNEEISFHPDMSHQMFGEKEQIFGYADLQVDIFYTASKLHGFVRMKYSDKIDPDEYDGVEVEDVYKKLEEVLPPGCCQSLDKFSALLAKDSEFHPHGDMVHQYKRTSKDGTERSFVIFHPDIDNNPGFREYHDRMQTFLLWFVDAACYIDVDDRKWEFYTVYEKINQSDGKSTYPFMGYCTVYNFYAYPEHCRPRISQFLILPPYQRQGHAAEVLDAVQKQLLMRANIRDICVEDPSENFQRIRDYIDCRNSINFDCFQRNKLMEGFTTSMVQECNEKLKLNKRQSRRIYEILRLKNTNMFGEAMFKPYRIDVKRRLNQPYIAKSSGKKIDKGIMPSDEERFKILDSEFALLLEEYLLVVDRLNRDAV